MRMTFCLILAGLLVVGGNGFGADEAVKEVVLFDGKSLDDWEMVDIGASGYVELDEDLGEMLIRQGDSLSGAIYKKAKELPIERYEISLEAKRTAGVDFFCGLTFPVGNLETCATLVLGGWGGSVTGISSIDGDDASNNATGTYQRYEDDKWYAIRLRVTPENLSAWIDGKLQKTGAELSAELASGSHTIVLRVDPKNLPASVRLESSAGTFVTN